MNNPADSEKAGSVELPLLNAYIDGELDSRSRREMQEILSLDPEASRYVVQAKKLNALTRLSLDARLNTPDAHEMQSELNARLADAEAQPRHRQPESRTSFWERPQIAIAASILLLVSGYHLGSMSLQYEVEKQLLTLEQQRDLSLAAVTSERNRVLEYLPSGESANWSSEDGLITAELTPVRTLRTEQNQFCREYKEVVSLQGKHEIVRGISCRVGKEQWRTRYLLPKGTPLTM